jgi:hypothetical protein
MENKVPNRKENNNNKNTFHSNIIANAGLIFQTNILHEFIGLKPVITFISSFHTLFLSLKKQISKTFLQNTCPCCK